MVAIKIGFLSSINVLDSFKTMDFTSMIKWKRLKKVIKLKALLNVELSDYEAKALKNRNLKVKDNTILPKRKYEDLTRAVSSVG